MDNYHSLKNLINLNRLNPSGINYIHTDERFVCQFAGPVSFNNPILRLFSDLPLDYLEFLKICNGCILFNDIEYGGECEIGSIGARDSLYEKYNSLLLRLPNRQAKEGFETICVWLTALWISDL